MHCRQRYAADFVRMPVRASPRQILSPAEVKGVEDEIDAFFNKTQLPDVAENLGRRLVCVVYEDLNRWLLDQAANQLKSQDFGMTMTHLMVRMDSLKYALRESLWLFSNEKNAEKFAVRDQDIDASIFKKIIDHSIQYNRASRIFYGYHNGDTALEVDDDGIIYTSENEMDLKFYALEASVHTSAPRNNAFDLVVYCFVADGSVLYDGRTVSWSKELKGIVRRSRERKGNIRYHLITQLAKPIYRMFRQQTELLIENWTFPWGSMQQTADFLAALDTIGLYHLISVHEGAKKANLKDLGIRQIIHTTNSAELIQNVCRISGIKVKIVEGLIEAFTYGNRTRNPDPVLQPLIPVDEEQIAFPAAMFLSSNWPRNALSLHARVSPATFDSQSKAFEKIMTASLEGALKKTFDVTSNVFFSTSDGREEVDLVVTQRGRNVSLLCELRWMLQPGDPAEVHNRLRAIRKKVSQIDRKYERITKSDSKQSVNYLPIVIIDGYGGTQSPVPTKIPIVNSHVLIRLCELHSDLEFIHAFLCTPIWLPRAGRDFEVEREAESLCGRTFSQTGIRPLGNKYLEQSLPAYFDEVRNLTAQDLRSRRWW